MVSSTNRLTRWKLRVLWALTFLALGAAPGSASAAMLTLNSSGLLTGATDVDVLGVLYDVEFVDATCITAFAGCDSPDDFTFQTFPEAVAASQALLDQVFVDGPAGSFNSIPSLTFGCPLASDLCIIVTPYVRLTSTRVDVSFAINRAATPDAAVFGIVEPAADFASFSAQTYARWTPTAAPVPEPASMMLLGTGLVGLGARRWRQRRLSNQPGRDEAA